MIEASIDQEIVRMPMFSSEEEKQNYLQRMFTEKGYYPSVGAGGMGVDFVNKPEYISGFAEEGFLPTMSAVLLGLGEEKNQKILFGPKEERMVKNRTKFSKEQNKKVLVDRIEKVREQSPHAIFGINLMHAVDDYKEILETIGTTGEKNKKGEIVSGGVDIIFVGAGMPRDLGVDMKNYPHMKYVPIVSSSKVAKFMMMFAKRGEGRLPDAFYVEHPDVAGGHLGKNKIEEGGFDAEKVIKEIREHIKEFYREDVHIPIILGGGISYREDIDQALAWGYDSVNIGTRAILTQESGLPNKVVDKKYLTSKRVETTLKSPAGLPSNSVPNQEMEVDLDSREIIKNCIKCIKSCKYLDAAKEAMKLKEIFADTKSYCIADKLSMTRHGIDGGLLFSGKELGIIKNDPLYRIDQEIRYLLEREKEKIKQQASSIRKILKNKAQLRREFFVNYKERLEEINFLVEAVYIPKIGEMVEFILNPDNKRPIAE